MAVDLVAITVDPLRLEDQRVFRYRGDFYLNGRRDEMLEVSGTVRGSLDARFSKKREQILLNAVLRKALVSVSRFASATSRLERVR